MLRALWITLIPSLIQEKGLLLVLSGFVTGLDFVRFDGGVFVLIQLVSVDGLAGWHLCLKFFLLFVLLPFATGYPCKKKTGLLLLPCLWRKDPTFSFSYIASPVLFIPLCRTCKFLIFPASSFNTLFYKSRFVCNFFDW